MTTRTGVCAAASCLVAIQNVDMARCVVRAGRVEWGRVASCCRCVSHLWDTVGSGQQATDGQFAKSVSADEATVCPVAAVVCGAAFVLPHKAARLFGRRAAFTVNDVGNVTGDI